MVPLLPQEKVFSRLEAFENEGSVMLFCIVYIVCAFGRPADHVCAKQSAESKRGATILEFISDEMRAGKEVKKQVTEELIFKPLFTVALAECGRELTANNIRAVKLKPTQVYRVKRFDAVCSVIAVK